MFFVDFVVFADLGTDLVFVRFRWIESHQAWPSHLSTTFSQPRCHGLSSWVCFPSNRWSLMLPWWLNSSLQHVDSFFTMLDSIWEIMMNVAISFNRNDQTSGMFHHVSQAGPHPAVPASAAQLAGGSQLSQVFDCSTTNGNPNWKFSHVFWTISQIRVFETYPYFGPVGCLGHNSKLSRLTMPTHAWACSAVPIPCLDLRKI